MAKNVEARLTELVAKAARHDLFAGVTLAVATKDRRLECAGGAGDLGPDTLYFIASTTKLYTTAVVFALEDRGKLRLDDRVRDHVDASLVRGLQTFGGTDHGDALTIRHLVSHTSGIPDYFSGAGSSGTSLEKQLLRGEDEGWDVEGALARARTLPATFAPGAPGKALYSDTNFQLLARVVESASGRTYAELLHELVFAPLELGSTYLYTDPTDDRPLPLRVEKRALSIPRAMVSFGPDGAIVSTARESLRFVRAFFEGELFSADRLPSLRRFNKVFFPLEYGVGIARFAVPWFMMPFGKRPELVGHSGLSGAFAWYCPTKEVYLAGTVNQVSRPDLAFRMLIKATTFF